MVVWATLLEKHRCGLLRSSMITINGWIHQEVEVVHLVTPQLFDPPVDLIGLIPSGHGVHDADGKSGRFYTSRWNRSEGQAEADCPSRFVHVGPSESGSRNLQ